MTLNIDPADFGFALNNRELAALFWLGVVVVGVLSMKTVRPSLLGVLGAFFSWPLQRVFIAMTVWTVAAVAALYLLNLWEWSNLKSTLLWWLTVGFFSVRDAQNLAKEKKPFRRLLKDAINVTAVLTFITEFGSFPLLAEIGLLAFLTFVSMMLAVAPTQPSGAILIKPLTWILTIAGLGYLGWSLLTIAGDPAAFLTWDNAREFGDPILLSIAFIPFLFGLAVVMTHETIFTSLKIMWNSPDLAAYASRRAFWSFAHDIDGMQRLARDLKMNDIKDRQGVDDAIRLIRKLKRRERNPSPTPPERGWSPHEAIRFLESDGIVANDWHPAFDEWRAEKASFKLDERSLPDTVSYYLSGSEFATTKLVLNLNADSRNDSAASDDRFHTMVLRLLERALPSEEATAMLARLQQDVVIKEGGWRFSMKRDDWGVGINSGYGRRFQLTHTAHVPHQTDDEFYENLLAGEQGS